MDFQMAKGAGPGSAVISILGGVLIIALCVFLVLFFFTSRSYKLSIGAGRLKITSLFYNTDISLDDVLPDEAGLVDFKSIGISIRTNGIGLPGMMIGWFRGAGGKYKLYVTDQKHVLRIPTKLGYDILFSTDQAAEVIEQLRTQ